MNKINIINVKDTDYYLEDLTKVGLKYNINGGEIFNDYENNNANGNYSHAEGSYTSALTDSSHAEGNNTISKGYASHSEGKQTIASGDSSHSEGDNTEAQGKATHSEGMYNKSIGVASHTEGLYNIANSNYSHAEGFYTKTFNEAEHAEGKYNKSNTSSILSAQTLHSIGIGTSETLRKNALEVMANGDIYINGVGNYDGTNFASAKKIQDLIGKNVTLKWDNSSNANNIVNEGIYFLTGVHSNSGDNLPINAYTNGYIGGCMIVTVSPIDSELNEYVIGQNLTLSSKVGGETKQYIRSCVVKNQNEYNWTSWNQVNTLIIFGEKSNGLTSKLDLDKSINNGQYYGIYNDTDNFLPKGATFIMTVINNYAANSSANNPNYRQITQLFMYTPLSTDGSITSSVICKRDGIGNETINWGVLKNINDGGSGNGVGQTTSEGGEIFNDYTNNKATKQYAHAEGNGTNSNGFASHSEGLATIASGEASHAEGTDTYANGEISHAEGSGCTADGAYSHAEGSGTYASGESSHAEGYMTYTKALGSHAEGQESQANGNSSHAEGKQTNASGESSHAEGNITQAIGNYSHAEGEHTISSGYASHAEGTYSQAIKNYSHVEGFYTIANNEAEHAEGKCNVSNNSDNISGQTIHSIGIGTSPLSRKNAFEVMANGDVYIKGVGSYEGNNYNSSDSLQVFLKKLTISGGIVDAPSNNNIYGRKNNEWVDINKNLTAIKPQLYTSIGELTFTNELSHDKEVIFKLFNVSTENELFTLNQTELGKIYFEDNDGNILSYQVDSGNSGGNLTLTYINVIYNKKFIDGLITVSASKNDYGYYTYINNITSNIKTYSIDTNGSSSGGGSGDNGVGQATLENGEIFNDYSNNKATKQYSHSEGNQTKANGLASHTEGFLSISEGDSSHAEGYQTISKGNSSHAEGVYTNASGESSHTEGFYTSAYTKAAHAEGSYSESFGNSSHAEGSYTVASGASSHAEGNKTSAYTNSSHAEGNQTTASGASSHAEGSLSQANGNYSHSEGYGTLSNGVQSHAEGRYTEANGTSSHAEGYYTNSYGNGAHCEGGGTNFSVQGITSSSSVSEILSKWQITKFSMAKGDRSHCEGKDCLSLGSQAHSEGQETVASGLNSHTEGSYTKANGQSSHAEGNSTQASGQASHAEGNNTQANGQASHAEGSDTLSKGFYSHAEGYETIANNESEHAQGYFNRSNTGSTSSAQTLHSIGIGSSDSNRKNAVEVMQNGDIYINGIGGYDGTNYTVSTTLQKVISQNAMSYNLLNDNNNLYTKSDLDNLKTKGQYYGIYNDIDNFLPKDASFIMYVNTNSIQITQVFIYTPITTDNSIIPSIICKRDGINSDTIIWNDLEFVLTTKALLSNERPTNIPIGYQIFDLTLNKPIWYKGSNEWVNANGEIV